MATHAHPTGDPEERTWETVYHSPFHSLWNLRHTPARVIAARTWQSMQTDRIFGHAAELGFYFLFALFPTLFCASSFLGLAARSAQQFYDRLLDYLALVIPTAALGTVLQTFNETTAAASSGKLTFGLIAAIWSASVGISAVQDTLDVVYKVEKGRSYFVARIYAIAITIILIVIVTGGLASLLGADFVSRLAHRNIHDSIVATVVSVIVTIAGWMIATLLLALSFAVIYYWAPSVKNRGWHWLTPGGAIGIGGWLIASLGFRVYIHYFHMYSITYGSLGAVIILLTWFYITGLMLLLGAEINSEIDSVAQEIRLSGLPRQSTVEAANEESNVTEGQSS
ncbi:MAG: YihY/virulence factor BrkB family protein [Terracidiphilus sp.]|jgi:membrane protein